jgi:hypothetical protein
LIAARGCLSAASFNLRRAVSGTEKRSFRAGLTVHSAAK